MTDHPPHTGPERRSGPRSRGIDPVIRPVFEVLRWIRAHVSGFYGAIGAFLTLGLGLSLAAVLLFAGIAELVDEGVTQRFDDAVLLWMNEHASDELDVIALEITALGAGSTVWMVIAVGSLFLWLTRHRYSAVLLWVAVVGGNLLNGALKHLFDRPRPELFEWRTPYAGLSSFPSGHAMTAMVVYATLAYLVVRLEPGLLLRRATLAVAAIMILLIGLSRLYLGVHYPSDVIAAYLVGFVWATTCALGIEAVQYFRDRNPKAARQEEGLAEGTAPIRDAIKGDD
jgi:undecaprenyl-diphosphatase